MIFVDLTREGRQGLGGTVPEHLPAVKLEVVDRLGDVRVGLGPVLADLEDLPGDEFKLPIPGQPSGPKEDGRPFFRREPPPTLKGRPGGLEGHVHVLGLSLLEDADDLVLLGWIVGIKFLRCINLPTPDDQGVLPSQLGFDLPERLLHAAAVLRLGKVRERLVPKRRYVHGTLRPRNLKRS
jgi:hypothetical protein